MLLVIVSCGTFAISKDWRFVFQSESPRAPTMQAAAIIAAMNSLFFIELRNVVRILLHFQRLALGGFWTL